MEARVLALVAAALVAPPGAAAAPRDNCGDPDTSPARKRAVPGRAPFMIGDSVLMGAVDDVAGVGYDVNARGCRQMSEGLGVLARRGGRLPYLVVIMLGTNGEMEPGLIRRALRIIGRHRLLALVTPRRDPHAKRVIRAAGRRYPGRLVVIDWARRTARHPEWFAHDGNHLHPAGARALARTMRSALRYAAPLGGRWRLRTGGASGRDAFSAR